MLHASVDAFAALVRARGLVGADVAHITVEVDPIAAEYCDRPLPASINAARFSYSFALASVLLDGRVGYDTYTDAALAEPERRALQSKVTVVGDHANPPKDNGARLAIALADGGEVRLEVDTFLGHPNSPIPVPTMVELLRTDLAAYVPDAGRLDALVAGVMEMDSASSLQPLHDLLRDVHG
jgi:2-methylcitrate dehydratase PrpD